MRNSSKHIKDSTFQKLKRENTVLKIRINVYKLQRDRNPSK
jgi:hypothetical protein